MPLVGAWCKVWIYFGFVFGWTKAARPRFDTSTDMGLVLVPADAEVDSVIFRLRATDQDADFPLVFEITATITPVVRIDNLPCTLYNKVCQANVILTKRLTPGRLHDFAVRVRDTKGDSNSMQATISVTNATTPRDKIFPHIPSLIMVPEDTKPGKELDYLLVRANSRSGKPVYIELWQPKELFTIRQRQTPTQTRGVITLIGELDFETQSMYTLTMYATDPYTEPGKDTRNIAGLTVVVVVQDVQDVPPIFTLAPPLTRINNSVQPGDVIVRVHAEDGDKGVPREITYGLVSEGNPFTPFFNISETSGEITLARPLEELTQITHVGAPVVLTVVAEEIRRTREEPPAQATVVEVGFLLGEPGNSPPYFESDNYVAFIDENPEPGTVISFPEQYTTRVRDEDIGKAGVFALKLENNNGTFEINPTVAERTADFIITVRDNALIDYETYRSLTFKIVAQEVGPATNLSTSVPATIFLRDVNDNPPVFDDESYEVTLSENVTAGTRVVQVHATDKDTGLFGSVQYTRITGQGNEAFTMDPDTGLITVAMGTSLDREMAPRLVLSVDARDENGNGNRGVVPLIVNLLDVNDNAPLFEKDVYEFTLNSDLTNFTAPAVIRAIDADAEPPNNEVRYELIHGNYENKFNLNEITGELILRSPISKVRRRKQSAYESFAKNGGKEFVKVQDNVRITTAKPVVSANRTKTIDDHRNMSKILEAENAKTRRKRANNDALYTLTARAYDLGVPHLSSVTRIRVVSGAAMEARIVMFVVPGEHPDSTKTAETLAAITGGRVTVLENRPYLPQNQTHGTGGTTPAGGKKSIVVARVEQTEPGTPLVDLEKIRETLAANGVGIIGGGTPDVSVTSTSVGVGNPPPGGTIHTSDGQTTNVNYTVTNVHNEEVTVYKAKNNLLFWLLIILGLLMLLAIAALIICCTCPGCPFYMAPRKRRVHSSETLVARSDGRPKRHLHRKPAAFVDATWNGRKQAWSADPTRRNWQFNRRNTKNCGLASLPGDVAYISGHPNDVQVNIESLRMRDGPYDPSRRNRVDEQERMYVEDVEDQKIRGYDGELDSLQRHEMERGSDVPRQGYRQRYIDPETNEEATVREQHFYREGNAEVLRLVTRGQADEGTVAQHRHQQPTTFIVDGKDILLRRFMEDQKSREELSMQDLEAARSMESHRRSKEMLHQQPEIILIPEKLDLVHRQRVDELGPSIQRLVIDHGDYEARREDSQESRAPRKQEKQESTAVGASSMIHSKDQGAYSFHDLELARQNALLTRLLLEREGRQVTGGVADSTSYLETQSLPGQVAIATQTDRTAATQTERQVRSRSDNDESDEESRHKKKLKSKKRYGDGDWRRPRTLWMKSPIEEEEGPCFDKRLSILRKKVKEVKEGRKVSLEPEVLREISDSLDGNGSSYPAEEERSTKTYQRSTAQTIKYKVVDDGENGSPSSLEACKDRYEGVFGEKTHGRGSSKADKVESPSSPEIGVKGVKYGRSKASERSPRKEMKSKDQRKVDGIVKPSFRILEREITMLTKKLTKLGDKKFRESSDSNSHEKSESFSKDSRKDSIYRTSKRTEDSSSRTYKKPAEVPPSTSKIPASDQTTSQRKETSLMKTRQKLKYQQSQIISPGSSEYEETFEKPKRSPVMVQEAAKQKQPGQSHVKAKRQTQVERREHKKQPAYQDQELDKRKDLSTKDSFRSEKPEKSTRLSTRAPKLVNVSRKDHVSEDTSTSTDRNEARKVSLVRRDADKKSSLESSSNSSTQGSQRRPRKILERASERLPHDSTKQTEKREILHQGFSDDFVAQAEHQKTMHEVEYGKEMSDKRHLKDSTRSNQVKPDIEKLTVVELIPECDTKSIRKSVEIATIPSKAEDLRAKDLIPSTTIKKESDSGESSSSGGERQDEIAYTRFETRERDESQEQTKDDTIDRAKQEKGQGTQKLERIEVEKESSSDSTKSVRKKELHAEEETKKTDESQENTEKQIVEPMKDFKDYEKEFVSTVTAVVETEPEKKTLEDKEENKILHDSEKPMQTIVLDKQVAETKESELLNVAESGTEEQLRPSVDTKTLAEIEKYKLEKEEPSKLSDRKIDHIESIDTKFDNSVKQESSMEDVNRETSIKIEKIEEKKEELKNVIETVKHKETGDTSIDTTETTKEITTILEVPEDVKVESEKAETVAEVTEMDEVKDIKAKQLSQNGKISECIEKRTPSPTEKSTDLATVTLPVATEDDKKMAVSVPQPGIEIQKSDTISVGKDIKDDETQAVAKDTPSTKTIDMEEFTLSKDIKTDTKIPEHIDDKSPSPTRKDEKIDSSKPTTLDDIEPTSKVTTPESSKIGKTPHLSSSKEDIDMQESTTIESQPTTTSSQATIEKKPDEVSPIPEATKEIQSTTQMAKEESSHVESVEVPTPSDPSEAIDVSDESTKGKDFEDFEAKSAKPPSLTGSAEIIAATIKMITEEKLDAGAIEASTTPDSPGTIERGEELKVESKSSESTEVSRPLGDRSFDEEGGRALVVDLDKTFGEETAEVERKEDKESRLTEEGSAAGKYGDVSLPLFSSVIDTLGDSDESDSSSDVSRKTTLTTRPYHTPRHRALRSPEKTSAEVAGKDEVRSDESDVDSILAADFEDYENFETLKVEKRDRPLDKFTVAERDAGESDAAREDSASEKFGDKRAYVPQDESIPSIDIEPACSQEPEKAKSSTEPIIRSSTSERDKTDIESTIEKSQETKYLQPSLEPGEKSLISTKEQADTGDSKAETQKPDVVKTTSQPTKETSKDTSDQARTEKSDSSKSGTDYDRDKTDRVSTIISKTKSHKPDDSKSSSGSDNKSSRSKKDQAETSSSRAKTQKPKKEVKDESTSTSEHVIPKPTLSRTSGKTIKQSSTLKVSSTTPLDETHDEKRNRGRVSKQAEPDSKRQKDIDTLKAPRKKEDESSQKQSTARPKQDKDKKSPSDKSSTPSKTSDIDTSKTRSKYMSWYKKKREEMERRRAETKAAEEEEQLPRWLRRSLRHRKSQDEKRKEPRTPEMTPRTRRKVKPLVNVESEQLKAIVRQGRKLRRAEGGANEDPPIQIFATSPPPVPETKHHLVQHSEYKYERVPPPFYLHPPPVPHPSPQVSPEHFEAAGFDAGRPGDEVSADIAVPLQGAGRLRHQQLLEKKSVFDIAYNEAAPSQLRADSTTPPS